MSRNLHEALLYLRHRGTQTFWIDAICINQSNPAERADQVRIMKQIYNEASCVMAWLGPGTVETGKAFRFLDLIDHQVGFYWPFDKPSINIQLYNTCPDEELAAVSELLSRPWFRRVWIIQEVLAATQSVSGGIWVYCGKQARHWDGFISGFNALSHSCVLGILPQTDEVVAAIQQVTFFTSTLADKYELVVLMSKARRAEATNPRDKVYALLSLAKDGGNLHIVQQGRTVPFLVDYDISVRQVYMNAAQAMIISSGLEPVLVEACNKDSSIQNLPTWVPDWSVQSKTFSIDWERRNLEVSKSERIVSIEDSRRYFDASKAKGALPRTPRFHKDRFLLLAGITVDSIQVVSETYPESREGNDIFKNRYWFQKCDWLSAKFLSTRATVTAHDELWRVLIADRVDSTQPAPSGFR